MARATGAGNAYLFRHGLPISFDEANWSLGIMRDLPRSALPEGAVYNAVDYLVDMPGRLRKRGGSTFASPVAPAGQLINNVSVCEFANDARVIMISSEAGVGNHVYDVTNWTGTALASAEPNLPGENCPFWVHGGSAGSLIVTHGFTPGKTIKRIVRSGGVGSALTWDTSSLAGAPQAHCSCIHLNRLVVANTDDQPNRVWFSQINDPTDFSTANNFIDTAAEVTGLASIQGTLLIFHRGSIQRVLREIPPGYEGENMQIEPLVGNVGTFPYGATICQARSVVYFANEQGIYYTNGSGVQSITTRDEATGIGALWRTITRDLDSGLGAVMAQGVYADTWLFSSLRHPDPAGMDLQLICHLPTNAFTVTSLNIACVHYASQAAPHAALYGCNGNYSEPVRLLNLTSLFTPYPGPKADAAGQAVLPLLETRMIGPGPGLKSYGDSHITYDIRDAAVDNPTFTISVGRNIEGSYWEPVPESFPKTTTEARRRRFTVSKDANSIQFRVQQVNASERTEIYMIESQYHPYFAADGI